MKLSVILLLGLLTSAANAAITECTYQETPCDTSGNHYQCRVFAWANHEYCSPTDRSTRRKLLEDQRETFVVNGKQCRGFWSDAGIEEAAEKLAYLEALSICSKLNLTPARQGSFEHREIYGRAQRCIEASAEFACVSKR